MNKHSLAALLHGFVANHSLQDNAVNLPAMSHLSNNVGVSGLALDSRKVQPGDLFFAMPGTQTSGGRFIQQAIENGASAVVIDADAALDTRSPYRVPVLRVEKLKAKAGDITARFFANPTESMRVLGVTGTNGKTTCAHFLAQAYSALNKPSGFIGTLGAGLIENLTPGELTTPDVISLQRECKTMLAGGAECVTVEASSHGLDQYRLNGVRFDVGIFTNLTHDHLDYHENMQTYGAAKAKLFAFASIKHAVINIDDVFGRKLADAVKIKNVWRYGLSQGDFRVVSSELNQSGIQARFQTPSGEIEIAVGIIGRFNLYNLLAVTAVLHADGFSSEQIQAALTALRPVGGRMQTVVVGDGNGNGKEKFPGVVVDYSHTPDALQNALESVREHTQGRLHVVFGCGGGRDKHKRAVMGAIAQRLADVAVVTDDNPRDESANDITDQVLAGFNKTDAQAVVINDRQEAIEYAIKNAAENDVVLIAGKGHETTQTIGSSVIAFSDVEKARHALRQRA